MLISVNIQCVPLRHVFSCFSISVSSATTSWSTSRSCKQAFSVQDSSLCSSALSIIAVSIAAGEGAGAYISILRLLS